MYTEIIGRLLMTAIEVLSYVHAIALYMNESPHAHDCEVMMSVDVDNGGSLSFERSEGIDLFQTTLGDGRSQYVITGSAEDVGVAVASFSFCPACIDKTYSVSFALQSICSICNANVGDVKTLTIYAATALSKTFFGRVVEVGCGAECWHRGIATVSVVIDLPGSCNEAHRPLNVRPLSNRVDWDALTASTATDGSYTIQAPYQKSAHGLNTTISYSRPGYAAESISVTLGALSLGAEYGRYYWQSLSDSGAGCIDGSTLKGVAATYCALAGLDMCAIFANNYRSVLARDSYCQCWGSAKISEKLGTCSWSAAVVQQNSTACAELGLTPQKRTGFPCTCDDTKARTRDHIVDSVYLTPKSHASVRAPTKMPLQVLSTGSPTETPSLYPTSVGLILAPSNFRPLPVPSRLPSCVPSSSIPNEAFACAISISDAVHLPRIPVTPV